jgi:iron complex outermembrane receptor protein
VFKGPAGIQYGIASPGGTLNLVTKRPVPELLAQGRLTIGSFDFYRGEVDLGGAIPGTAGNLWSRLNVAYESSHVHRDFDDAERVLVAPALQYNLGEHTTFAVELNYLNNRFRFNRGLPPQPFILPLPFERTLMEPNLPISENNSYAVFWNAEHRFRLGNSRWQARQSFGYVHIDSDVFEINTGVADIDADGNISRRYFPSIGRDRYWTLTHELAGDFATGPLAHKTVVGVQVARSDFGYQFFRVNDPALNPPPLNVFAPVYGRWTVPSSGQTTSEPFEHYGSDRVGVYVDHQAKLLPNLKLLVGMRVDWIYGFYEQRGGIDYGASDSVGFSPRAGVVYTPVPPLDLFFNYSTSYEPNLFTDAAGNTFDPEKGRQFEGGIRYEIVPGRLRAGGAVFSITKDNVLVPDPTDPTGRRSILTGQQRSDGFEVELIGTPLDGWDVVLGYAYTDARISKDTDPANVGDRLVDAPFNQVGLWTKYAFQHGFLRGGWLGYGLFYAGQRRSSFANESFLLPSYIRHDAALGYRWQHWSAQVNLENLTDERVYDSHGNNIHLQPPLNVRGSLTFRY